MPNRDRRLAELAAISQLFGAVQGPQVRQQESQQQNALAILGLLSQQQHQQEALSQASQMHKDEMGYRTNELNQRTTEADQRHNDAIASGTGRLKEAGIHDIFGDPTIPIHQKLAAAAAIDPMFAKVGPAMEQQNTQDMTAKAAPGFKMAYLAGAKDPKILHTQMDALKAALPEDVFNNQDWTSLNQSLPAAGAAAPSRPIPEALGAGIRNLPIAAAQGLQNAGTGYENFMGNLLSGLFNVQEPPDPKTIPVRPWGFLSK